jgi:hypothetical protein
MGSRDVAAEGRPTPPRRWRWRGLVGDAQVLADMRANHGDDTIEVHFLDGDDFRTRYTELSGTNYWA